MNGLDRFRRDGIRKPVTHGQSVYVYDGHNNLVECYSAVELGVSFFKMSNDSFYDMYGFNWFPKGRVFDIAKRKATEMR